MFLQCSHGMRCSEIALILNLAWLANLVCKFGTVFPIYVAEQPGQENF